MASRDPFRFGFIVLLCFRCDFLVKLIGCSEERDFDVKSSWSETYPERNDSTTFAIDVPWTTNDYTELTTERGVEMTTDSTLDELYYTPKPYLSTVFQDPDTTSEHSSQNVEKSRKYLEGNDYTIRCSRVGDLVWNVKWRKDGKTIVFGDKIIAEKQGQDVIRILNFGPEDVGAYSCKANTRYGIHRNRHVIRPDELSGLPPKKAAGPATTTKRWQMSFTTTARVPTRPVPTKPPPDNVFITRCKKMVSRRTVVSYDRTAGRRQSSDMQSQVHEFVVKTNEGAETGMWRCETRKVEESDEL